MNWDDLPGDAAADISDAEDTIDRINYVLDREDKSYDLIDLEIDLEEARRAIQRAIDAIRGYA